MFFCSNYLHTVTRITLCLKFTHIFVQETNIKSIKKCKPKRIFKNLNGAKVIKIIEVNKNGVIENYC